MSFAGKFIHRMKIMKNVYPVRRIAILALLSLSATLPPVIAASRVDGTVVDPQGAPLAGAVITVVNAQGTVLQETISDSSDR